LEGASVSVTNELNRSLKLGEARLREYEEHMSKRRSREAYLKRVQCGQAADWNMTEAELWQHVEAGNDGAIRAGMKAKLPVLVRSKDGMRTTVMHVACRQACSEAIQAATEDAKARALWQAAVDAAKAEAATKASAQATETSATKFAEDTQDDAVVGSVAAEVDRCVGETSAAADAGAGPASGARADVPSVESEEPAAATVDGTSGAPAPGPVVIDLTGENQAGDVEMLPPPPALVSEEIQRRRLETIKVLLNSRAIPNTIDAKDRTPLDLALLDGGPEAANLPIVQKMRDLGLLTMQEAGAAARAEEEAKAVEKAAAKKLRQMPVQPSGR
jgi:hypothetical protein